jgi:DnaJ family protein C protein 11
MTSNELREHFQAQYIATKAIEVDQLVKSRGDMTAVLDARAVFAPRSAFRNQALPQDPISRAGRLRVGQINMKHSFEVPVTLPWDSAAGRAGSGSGTGRKVKGQNKTQVQIQGQMAARNGAGGGNVVGTVRHQFSPACWGEVGYSLMAPRIMTAKGAYSIDEHT